MPSFLGRREVEVDLASLRPFIDWTFFFAAWELKGRYPAILDHPTQGEAARELFEHAMELLDTLERDEALRARGVYGFWPAASAGDDIVVFGPDGGGGELARFPMLRQQEDRDGASGVSRSLADFVAPLDGVPGDHLGAFAVTAGLGVDAIVERFRARPR